MCRIFRNTRDLVLVFSLKLATPPLRWGYDVITREPIGIKIAVWTDRQTDRQTETLVVLLVYMIHTCITMHDTHLF